MKLLAIFAVTNQNQLLKSNSFWELRKGCLRPWAARHIFSDYPPASRPRFHGLQWHILGWCLPVSLKFITPCQEAICEKVVKNMPI